MVRPGLDAVGWQLFRDCQEQLVDPAMVVVVVRQEGKEDSLGAVLPIREATRLFVAGSSTGMSRTALPRTSDVAPTASRTWTGVGPDPLRYVRLVLSVGCVEEAHPCAFLNGLEDRSAHAEGVVIGMRC